ncbi:hypothetical protein N868_13570 [Cellulomonas carbonis T26]|uniref:Acetyltransferase n=2 Tax=Cellulomonas carbonis TaxID=1386092 RepID=A0A0A0BQT4_9CELL|nr:hypothetical protein N868_13570 [Cellulomonas carbonis T26]
MGPGMGPPEASPEEYSVRLLDASTWDVFAELVERNNGIFGGCWCLGWHPEGRERGISRREVKEERRASRGSRSAPRSTRSRARAGAWSRRSRR